MHTSRWLVLAAVFVARTSMGYQFQAVGSVGPLLVVQLAIDFAVLGSLIGAYKLPGVLLAIPSGLLGNRFGEKSMLVLGMVLMAAGGGIAAESETAGMILTGRVISGLGAVLFNVLSAKMIADWFAGKELTLAFAIYVNSWPFGIALGLASQAALAQWFSISGMFWASAGFCAFAALLLLLGAENKNSFNQRGAATVGSSALFGGLSSRELVLVSVAAMVWLLFNANLIVVVSFAPSYLVSLGVEVAEAGRLTSLSTWLGIAAIPLGGVLVQRGLSASWFMAMTLLAGSAATFAIVWFDDPLFAILAFGVLAWAPAGPIFALPVGVLQEANRAVGMGVFLSYYYLGIGIFPSLAGHLRDVRGEPDAPILFAGGLLVGALLMLLLFRWLKARWREGQEIRWSSGRRREGTALGAD